MANPFTTKSLDSFLGATLLPILVVFALAFCFSFSVGKFYMDRSDKIEPMFPVALGLQLLGRLGMSSSARSRRDRGASH